MNSFFSSLVLIRVTFGSRIMTSYFALNRHGCLIVHRGVRKGRELSRRMMEKGINDDWYPIISREDGIICLRVSCHRVWFAFRFRGGIVWCCTASTLVRCCGMRTMVSYSNTHNYGYELRSYLVIYPLCMNRHAASPPTVDASMRDVSTSQLIDVQ